MTGICSNPKDTSINKHSLNGVANTKFYVIPGLSSPSSRYGSSIPMPPRHPQPEEEDEEEGEDPDDEPQMMEQSAPEGLHDAAKAIAVMVIAQILDVLDLVLNQTFDCCMTPDLQVYKGNPAQCQDLQGEPQMSQFQVLLITYEYIIKDRPILSKLKWVHMIIVEWV
ncbi:uncharacterized protein F5147DRAFT_770036 [Suillus discolor]|uniref:Uncharacterized protein n=1 Tax=Suillus discolor TaxID=1912936 RepID=A0A9P7FF83_9AGAM|nr:uncharacterized protein F5147DRAFT_770036 [Suillus discolor]KAG2114722.1 hypothetical protein F5147DRAFT_770036 [Suillus discolor]